METETQPIDQDYLKFREMLKEGHQLPYREYIYVRAVYFIRHIATDKELQHLGYEMENKRENSNSPLLEIPRVDNSN
jgi:hypothetical protein